MRTFVDNLSHEWTMRFIQHRIADQRIHRLIQKWLKAGVSEDGEWSETKVGTPRFRSVDRSMAGTGGKGQSDGHSLGGGSGSGVRAPRRGRAVPEGAGEVRAGTASGEDAVDRVRTKRRTGARGAGGR